MQRWETVTNERDYSVGSTRPTSITVICTLLVISIAINVFQILSVVEYLYLVPAWLWIFAVVSLVAAIAVIIGLWRMKRWSVGLYAALFVANQLILIISDSWTWTSVILPPIVLIVGFNNYEDMD
jgi:hypothetical protein